MFIQDMSEKQTIIIKTLTGLEDICAEELHQLGLVNIKTGRRVLTGEGNLETLYLLNFNSRLSGRVLLQLNSFYIKKKNDIYQKVYNFPWDEWFTSHQTIAVDAIVNHSRIFNNSQYLAQLVKDAVVDRFRKKSGSRPNVELREPDIRINIYIEKNRAVLSLDSSGEPLHKRGYRTESTTAPLNELLACGCLLLSDWDKQTPLIDPMCGSGTFPIEAALYAANIVPGLIRKSYAFQNWKNYDAALLKKIEHSAKANVLKSLDCSLYGNDKETRALMTAKKNAINAGVEELITFQKVDFHTWNPPKEPGLLIFNPPYGERMAVDDTFRFYNSIGDTLKQKYSGYTAVMLTGNLKATKQVGLRTSRRITLYNGSIESRLLRYELYQGSRKQKYQDNNVE